MIHRRIPLCLTMTQAGQDVPPELPDAARLKEILVHDPAEQALPKIFDFSHRMDALLIAGISPEIIAWDAPPDDAFSDKLKDKSEIYPLEKKSRKQLRQTLYEKYYMTFYHQLSQIQAQEDVKAGIDCRVFDDSVLARGTHPRPLLCLANHGDLYGEKQSMGGSTTCLPEMLRDVRDVFSACFADMPGSVLLNTPISGGYLIGCQQPPKMPWFGLHIARSLLITGQAAVSEKRIENLRDRFETILVMISKVYAWL
ncbi:N-formylglutamate amidohydrolase [bacterium]|nr:N-formylglutamate amidohydrolase [bacterium]